jgi:hypothetical protein
MKNVTESRGSRAYPRKMERRGVQIAVAIVVLAAIAGVIAVTVAPAPTPPVSATTPPAATAPATSAVSTTASPTPTATAVPSPTPVRRPPPTPTPLATTAVAAGVTHENPILGYRITVPTGVRRAFASVTASGDPLGIDIYTYRTEAQDAAACQSDGGARPSPDALPDVVVDASLNPSGLSAETWATTPRSTFPGAQPFSKDMLVERTTVGGREAVRLVRDQATNHESTMYVIRGDDRMFTIYRPFDSIPTRLPAGVFDAIGTSLRVLVAAPRPTPTPTPATSLAERARVNAEALARAFSTKDVDTLDHLITPTCWLGSLPIVPPGTGVDGSNRAVIPLLAALRDQFGRGLTVSVDPAVQTQADGSGVFATESLYVRSTWSVPAGATRVNLFLSEIDGRVYWTSFRYEQTPVPPCDLRRVLFGSFAC